MSMAVGGSGGARADINVTPLIDVLLVLLIIFMVITPLTPKGLESLVPQPPEKDRKQPDDNQRTVVIVIKKPGSEGCASTTPCIMINQEASDEAKLGGRLADIFKTRAERVVFVKGDGDLEYQYVARAVDIAKGAGIDKVGLMTPKMEQGE